MEVTITLKDIKLEDLTKIFVAAFKSCGKVEIINNTYNQVDTKYPEISSKIDELDAKIQQLKNDETEDNEDNEIESKEYKTKDFRSGELYSRYCVRCNNYFDTNKVGGKICPKCTKPKGKKAYNPTTKLCKFCGEEFVSNYPLQLYCKEGCKKAYNSNVKSNEKGISTDKIKNMIDNGEIDKYIKHRE
jgi:hypothetical protein